MSRPADTDLLLHILEACATIQERVAGVKAEELGRDTMRLDSIVRQIEIIGEAVGLISEDLKKRHPQVPWLAIRGMRNRIVHAYWAVNARAVWEAGALDVPKLAEQMRAILTVTEQEGAKG